MHELKKEQDDQVERQPTDEAKMRAKVELYERRLAAKDAGQSALEREILDRTSRRGLCQTMPQGDLLEHYYEARAEKIDGFNVQIFRRGRIEEEV